jgi:hypothetical protein
VWSFARTITDEVASASGDQQRGAIFTIQGQLGALLAHLCDRATCSGARGRTSRVDRHHRAVMKSQDEPMTLGLHARDGAALEHRCEFVIADHVVSSHCATLLAVGGSLAARRLCDLARDKGVSVWKYFL